MPIHFNLYMAVVDFRRKSKKGPGSNPGPFDCGQFPRYPQSDTGATEWVVPNEII